MEAPSWYKVFIYLCMYMKNMSSLSFPQQTLTFLEGVHFKQAEMQVLRSAETKPARKLAARWNAANTVIFIYKHLSCSTAILHLNYQLCSSIIHRVKRKKSKRYFSPSWGWWTIYHQTCSSSVTTITRWHLIVPLLALFVPTKHCSHTNPLLARSEHTHTRTDTTAALQSAWIQRKHVVYW